MVDVAQLTESYAVGQSDPPVRDITLGELLREAATEAPERIALIEGIADVAARRSWTYAEMLAESERAARALLTHFEPGDHLAIWAPNSPEWIILEFGCALAGMVIVTVNPGYQPAELKYVLTQSKAKGLFVVDDFRGNPMLAMATDAQSECPDLQEILRFSEWQSFLVDGDAFESDLPAVAPMQPVMMQYTSGTTGFPKGALLHHRGLANNAHHFVDRLGMTEGQVYLTNMPLFHTAGSVMAVCGSVSLKATQVVVEVFDPALVLELCETYKVNAFTGVPTMMVALVEHPALDATNLESFDWLCSGGALVPEHLVRTFEKRFGVAFTIVYGQTECSPVLSMTRPTDTIVDKATTVGQPMPHCEVRVIRPETDETCAIGEIGEILTRGYHVMHEYFDMPEQTAETIDGNGWLHTGDLGAMDDRGYLTIEGRLKDMIIRGGENIYPKELEEILFQHHDVAEVAVVGLPDEKWGETVGAFIRPVPGKSVDKNELFAYLRERLAPHKTPRQWFHVESFPLTGSGKIQKYVLRDQWLGGDHPEL